MYHISPNIYRWLMIIRQVYMFIQFSDIILIVVTVAPGAIETLFRYASNVDFTQGLVCHK